MPEPISKGVLVVEDDEEIRELLGFILESEHYTVFQASDGRSALQLLREHTDEIVLVITDLGLPSLGGIDLIAEAHALLPKAKIISMSGLGGSNVRAMAMRAGADTFIAKPFKATDVVKIIQEMKV